MFINGLFGRSLLVQLVALLRSVMHSLLSVTIHSQQTTIPLGSQYSHNVLDSLMNTSPILKHREWHILLDAIIYQIMALLRKQEICLPRR